MTKIGCIGCMKYFRYGDYVYFYDFGNKPEPYNETSIHEDRHRFL